MPELPDLEVFAANLEKQFKNKTLETLHIEYGKKLNVTQKELKEKLEGHQLKEVSREGKTLQLHFGGGNVLGLHLMLHGQLKKLDPEAPVKYRILTFHFKGGDGFAFTDFQKQATPTLNPEPSKVPDAFGKDFTLTYFKELLAKKGIQIKQLLMDQKLIRGIGNTYADEILWHARISPFSIAKAIPEQKVKALYEAIDEVLRKEIMNLTKAIPDDFDAEVRDFLKVHDYKLEKSPTGYEIKTDTTGGRKTYYTEEQELFK
ncbi:Fpg/Nei family DNA glycosylase [Pedobacter sp. GR22-6]|uniref:Fpg/Nei family DNA glycosylase n=1 Tax=Pedobacter sp. GR22-6 TaxID=3127957 RepID=UPI00307D6183